MISLLDNNVAGSARNDTVMVCWWLDDRIPLAIIPLNLSHFHHFSPHSIPLSSSSPFIPLAYRRRWHDPVAGTQYQRQRQHQQPKPKSMSCRIVSSDGKTNQICVYHWLTTQTRCHHHPYFDCIQQAPCAAFTPTVARHEHCSLAWALCDAFRGGELQGHCRTEI